MPRSKLVIYRTPSRKLIIYLDSRKGNETCISCKFHNQEKTIIIERHPLPKATSVAKAVSSHDNLLNDEEPAEVTETHLEKQVAGETEAAIPYHEIHINSEEVLRTPSTSYQEVFLPQSPDRSHSGNLASSSERFRSGEILRVSSTNYKELSFGPHKPNDIKKSESDVIINRGSDIYEILPSTSAEHPQVTESSLAFKDPIASGSKELTASEQGSAQQPIRKAKFSSDVEVLEKTEQDEPLGENDIIVDEKFINTFTSIIETTDLTARKEGLDRLLKNISALELPTDAYTTDKCNDIGFWKIFKKKEPKRRVVVKATGRHRARASVPYFNRSFYSYRLKSRLEGLSFMPHRNYNYGEKGSGFQAKGAPQDFYQLRDDCLQRGELFEDPEFPPTDSSLFFSHRPSKRFEWRRPGEMVDNPQLFVEGFSRFDVQQGELGDCWLLAAVANLTLYRRLFFQIVPDDQSFDENYAGIFHFRFWQYGRWIDVVIDDRLPTYRGELVFLHSTEANEFWSALLEKAYAKLHGSYEALKGGSTCEAMEDFTGGVTEMYEMNASPPNLFKIVLKAYERWSLMGCSLEPDPNVTEAQTPQGLIRGHAYSITKVQYVNISTPNVSGKIPLLRLRNPWGNESEWNGAWSDHAPEWQYISDQQKEELGLNFDADGEFWISFKDFQTYFNRLEICNLNPDSLSEEELTEGRNKKWVMSVFEGEWVRGVTAGGCRNFLDTFWNNPQYRVTLEEADEGDDDDKCTMIVALMQKNRRQLRSAGAAELLTIGFAIYHLPYPDKVPKPLDLNFFKYNASVARSPSFINLREVSCRFKLPRGTYCIVPSTFDPNEEGEFLLRVFSEHQNNMEENDQEIGLTDVDIVRKVVKMTLQAKPKLSADEVKENDLVMDLFEKVAGRDKEVDWKELQEILNYYTRREYMAGDEPSANALKLDGVGAVQGQRQEEEQAGQSGPLTAILALICGAACKDTPLADLVPAPTQEAPLNEPYAETKNRGFSKDVCRSMIAMLDFDRTGKLNFEEFNRLWTMIRIWKGVFKEYDRNNSGTLNGFELRNALSTAGYTLNNPILNILMHRYGNKNGEIEFDDFIMCAVKLKIMIELFKEAAKSKTGLSTATFTLDDWIETTLYS